MTTTPRPRSGRPGLVLVAVLALVLGALGVPTTQADESVAGQRNVAVNATPSASFTASHNNLNAVNDGEHVNSGPPETSYWGTWTSTGRPATQFLQYDWIVPVEIDRTVVSFWTDVAPGTGANVTVPESWSVEYWNQTSAAWEPVPNPSGYGTSRTGTNETTFDPVATTRLRATFQAHPNTDATSYSALGVSEWEVWGDIAPADPDSVIDVPEVHTRTTPGQVPDLPDSIDVVRLNGRVTPVAVTWAPVDPEALVAGEELRVAGDLAGLAREATATVWVRETLATTIGSLDDTSVITTAGVRPALPATVTATFDDGAMDSSIAVTWEPMDRAAYAAEGFFAVEGAVEGTDLVPTAWVFVEPSDGSAPTPAPVATARPTVRGVPMVGRVLRATRGTWDLPDVTLKTQWLADGTPVPGATGRSYAVRRGDVGRRLSIRVTASKLQHPDGSAQSVPTDRVAKAATRTRIKPNRKRVRAGTSVRLTVRVKAPGVTPTGRVRIFDRGRLVRTVRIQAGDHSTRIRLRGTGRHRLVARYAGTRWAATSAGKTVVTVT